MTSQGVNLITGDMFPTGTRRIDIKTFGTEKTKNNNKIKKENVGNTNSEHIY